MVKVNGEKIKKNLEISDLINLSDSERNNVSVQGMIYNVRDMGDFAFIILRKATGLLQCVYNKNSSDDEKLLLKEENSVAVCGELVNEPHAINGVEIHVKEIKLLSHPKEELPFSINKKNMNIALEHEIGLRSITLRSDLKRSIFKLQEGVVRGFREYLQNNNFTEIFSPKIVSAGAEGGANIFKLDYFGKSAYLAQSPQVYKQMLIPVYERVFEMAPVFRAEKHDTARHLNEYVSVDFEMGFIDSFYDIINMETGMIKYTFKYLNENYDSIIKKLNIQIPEINEIPCIKFSEAKERVAEKYNKKIRDPYDLEPEEERLIGQLVKEEYDSDFVFVTHYPVKKRPFYALNDPENTKYTLSFDLLFRGME
ncbi:MAG: aspartyl-tRNA synthetase, partial [Clostridia bacterium]|nr:aspartyl-tRNA synthetase [Clostridia bacterium]